MDGSGARLSQIKRQLESELLEEVRLRRTEWDKAPEGQRDLARYRYMDALDALNQLLRYGKLPSNHVKQPMPGQ